MVYNRPMIKPYKKDYNFSYTLGFYPSFELVRYHKEQIVRIITDTRSYDSEGLQKLHTLLPNIDITVSDKDLSKLSDKGNDHVAIIFKKYEEELDPHLPHVVLVNPSDQGNLGNIMRSMAAFNYRDLAIITPAADRFNPKVIRSSMGSAFFVRTKCFQDFESYLQAYPRNYYPFMLQAKRGLASLKLSSPYALVFGNEARGLDLSFLNENAVKIEQPGDIDSLNLPTAVAIALYNCRLN